MTECMDHPPDFLPSWSPQGPSVPLEVKDVVRCEHFGDAAVVEWEWDSEKFNRRMHYFARWTNHKRVKGFVGISLGIYSDCAEQWEEQRRWLLTNQAQYILF